MANFNNYFSNGKHFTVTHNINNTQFIGTVVDAFEDSGEVEMRISRVIQGPIMDNYDEEKAVNDVGTFNTMTWNFTNYNRKRSRVDGGSRRKVKRRKTRKVRRRKHY
jgi:hypothetical protein